MHTNTNPFVIQGAGFLVRKREPDGVVHKQDRAVEGPLFVGVEVVVVEVKARNLIWVIIVELGPPDVVVVWIDLGECGIPL